MKQEEREAGQDRKSIRHKEKGVRVLRFRLGCCDYCLLGQAPKRLYTLAPTYTFTSQRTTAAVPSGCRPVLTWSMSSTLVIDRQACNGAQVRSVRRVTRWNGWADQNKSGRGSVCLQC